MEKCLYKHLKIINMRIAILAYACSPTIGSEFRLGWNLPISLANRGINVDVYLGSSDGEMGEFEYIRNFQPPEGSINFFLIKPSILASTINFFNLRFNLNFMFYPALRIWNFEVLKHIRKNNLEYDLTHHLGPIGFREPGYLHKIERPHVWGPIGGAQKIPFYLYTNRKLRILFKIKDIINQYQLKTSRIKSKVNGSDYFIFSTEGNRNAFKKTYNISGQIISDQAVTEKEIKSPKLQGIKKFVFVGSLSTRKNILPLLEIFENNSWNIDVVGSGPLLTVLRKKYSNSKFITIHGFKNRIECINIMRNSDCLVLPSLTEANTAVIYEAISQGIAVLANDRDGMATELPSEFKVPINHCRTNSELMVEWEMKISQLMYNTKIDRIKSLIIDLQKEKTWNKMAMQYEKIYKELIGRNSKPILQSEN